MPISTIIGEKILKTIKINQQTVGDRTSATNKMTNEELNEKMEKILEENNLDWQSVHLWIMNKGYVIITEEQYDNLEVIDPDGPCP